MGDYFAQLGGARILNATRTDQSGADDTNVIDWVKTNDFILAVNIHSVASKDTVAAQHKLKWRALPSGTFTDMVSTGAINYSATTDLVNGAAIAVGGRKCTTQGYTWQDGEEVEGAINSDSIDLATDYESEIHFALDCSGAADNTEYEFELWDDTKEAVTGTVGATIKMETGAVTRELVTTIAATTASTSGIDILREFTSTLAVTTSTAAAAIAILRECTSTIAATTALSQIYLSTAESQIKTENKRRSARSQLWNVIHPVSDGNIGTADRRHAAGYYSGVGAATFELSSTIAVTTALSQIDLLTTTLRELTTTIAATTSTSAAELQALRELTSVLAAQTGSTATIKILREIDSTIAA
jgi:hypothetical protein